MSVKPLTVPQYHMLNRLRRGPIPVYGTRRMVANNLARQGLVHIVWRRGYAFAAITAEGHRRYLEESG